MLGWLIPRWAKDSYLECDSYNFERTLPSFFWLQIRE